MRVQKESGLSFSIFLNVVAVSFFSKGVLNFLKGVFLFEKNLLTLLEVQVQIIGEQENNFPRSNLLNPCVSVYY